MTPQEFAAKIRAKYPGSYDNIEDGVLVDKILAKYPQYKDQVDLGGPGSTSTSGAAAVTAVPPAAEPAEDPAPPDSTPVAFAKGVGDAVIGLPKFILEMVTSPIKTTGAMARGSLNEAGQLASNVLKGVGVGVGRSPYERENRRVYDPKSVEEEQRAAIADAPISALGTAPVVGPGTADMVRGSLEGNPRSIGQVAGSVGMAAVLPKILPKRKGPGKIEEPAAPKPGEAPLPKVELTPGEAAGPGMLQTFEKALEVSAPGRKPYSGFRERQSAQVNALADEVVNRVSKYKGTPEEMGRSVRKNVKEAVDALKAKAGEIYAQVDQMATEGARPKTQLLKVVAKDLRRRLEQQSLLVGKPKLQAMMDDLDTIIAAPDAVDFRVMQDFRSRLLAKTREIKDLIPDQASAYTKRMSAAADTAMKEAAAKVPGMSNKLAEANGLWREATGAFNESVMSRLAKSKLPPEKIADVVLKAPLEDVRVMKKHLSRKVMQRVKARILRDILDQASGGEVMSGLSEKFGTVGEVVEKLRTTTTAPETALSGKKLKTRLEKIGQERLEEFFDPVELKNINHLTSVAERVGGTNVSSNFGLLFNSHIFYGIIRGITNLDPGALVQAGLESGAINLAARAMVRKRGNSRVLANYLEAFEKAGGNFNNPRLQAAATAASRTLAETLVEEAEASPDQED